MQLARPKINRFFFLVFCSFLTRKPGRYFFFSPFFTFYDSATGRCCVQCCSTFLVSAFSFGVYTPLEVISDRSLTTPYNVLNCILRVLRTTNVCEDIVPHTEYSMFLVKWPTYWKQTTLFTTQV